MPLNRPMLRARMVCVALALLPNAGGVQAAAESAPTLAELFKRVDPAVVEIHVRELDLSPILPNQAVSVAGLGSGVLISPDGRVLTAAHVVQTADAIEVEFSTGEVFAAKVLSSEPPADLAILQLEKPPRGAAVAVLGDSDTAEVGDPVFVVGAPLGASHTLTAGHISARRRPNATFNGMLRTEFFQTDAPINQGNSGGPLFNMRGEVIGIVSHIMSRSGGSEGLGFAVTSNVARQLLDLKSFWSGVSGYMVSGDLAQVLNVPPPGVGLLIERVAPRSPAESLGLKGGMARASIGDEDLVVGGDIILSVLGVSLAEPDSLTTIRRKLTELGPNERLAVVVLRGGKVLTLTTLAPARP